MSQDPMPLDPELLEMESELRALVPLEMDFATAQRLTQALEHDLGRDGAGDRLVLDGGGGSQRARVAAPPTSVRAWWPWAAAAGLAVAGFAWVKFPDGSGSAGLVPANTPDNPSARGLVRQVFPPNPPQAPHPFGPSGTEFEATVTDPRAPQPARRTTIPEATSPYGFLNVTVFELDETYCRRAGIKGGVCVHAMGAEGPAIRQGIEIGDIILEVDGNPVRTSAALQELIRNTLPGTELLLTIKRRQMIGRLAVRLGSAPSA